MNLGKAIVEASEGSAPSSADVNGFASRIAVPIRFPFGASVTEKLPIISF